MPEYWLELLYGVDVGALGNPYGSSSCTAKPRWLDARGSMVIWPSMLDGGLPRCLDDKLDDSMAGSMADSMAGSMAPRWLEARWLDAGAQVLLTLIYCIEDCFVT